ncbi:MAG: hypothetical protein WBA09_22345 [Candidatus Acidiferrum sp.]
MAILARPALNQAIAIIQKYQSAAISDLGLSLDLIQEFHKGPKARTAFPWVTVAYEGTAFSESSEQTREQHLLVVVALESGNFDSELAQDQAIDYMRMLDYIFTVLSAPTFVDWETALPIQHETVPGGVTTPWITGTVKEIFIEREEQSLVLREGLEVPVMQVSLHLRFDLEEAIS